MCFKKMIADMDCALKALRPYSKDKDKRKLLRLENLRLEAGHQQTMVIQQGSARLALGFFITG